MDTKEQLKNKIQSARKKLNKIEDAESREENQKLIGKCFRYKNNYSCPEKPSDYWWLYRKVVKVNDDGSLSVFEFQTDKVGQIRVYPGNWEPGFKRFAKDYGERISLGQFNKHWNKLKLKIANLDN